MAIKAPGSDLIKGWRVSVVIVISKLSCGHRKSAMNRIATTKISYEKEDAACGTIITFVLRV